MFNIFVSDISTAEVKAEVYEVRIGAMKMLEKDGGKEQLRALFEYFKERFPHWECSKEFNRNNLIYLLLQMSRGTEGRRTKGTGITMPRFMIVSVDSSTGRSAAVKKKAMKCCGCDKKASRSSKLKLPTCRRCAIFLGCSIRKGVLSTSASPKEMKDFLRRNIREKQTK